MRNLLNNIKNEVTNRKQQIKAALITLYLSIGIATPVFAAPNVAENASRWFLDQIFWVVIGVALIAAARAYRGSVRKMRIYNVKSIFPADTKGLRTF